MGVLKVGSSGAEVTELQNNLAKFGFNVTVDGKFGPQTKIAVEEFQAHFGYTIDGIVGDGTQSLISAQKGYGWSVKSVKSALESQGKQTDKGQLAGADFTKTLKAGEKGGEVAMLQRRLQALGFSAPVTGEFDSATTEAVKGLQSAFGYTVDGIAGGATNKLINAQIGYDWHVSKQNGGGDKGGAAVSKGDGVAKK